MRKIFAVLMIALTISSAALAQDSMRQRRTPEERAKHQVEMLQDLKLTEAQQQEIYKFNLDLPAGDRQNGEDREARKTRSKEIREKRGAAYQKIMTKEQFAQYERLQAQRRAQKIQDGNKEN